MRVHAGRIVWIRECEAVKPQRSSSSLVTRSWKEQKAPTAIRNNRPDEMQKSKTRTNPRAPGPRPGASVAHIVSAVCGGCRPVGNATPRHHSMCSPCPGLQSSVGV